MIVRADLPLGVLAAQLVHAAGESSPGNLPPSAYAIVLAVPDESALTRLAVRLGATGVRFKAIREPDVPWNNALMAIGVLPALRSELRRHFANLPLLRESSRRGSST